MKKNVNPASASLRRTAEENLKKKQKNLSADKLDLTNANDSLKLIHELEVHQIELELQNEELIKAKTIEKKATEKYRELYDFAPSGYFTLSGDGKIIDLNLYGSQMIGKDRAYLKNKRLGVFISDATKPVFNQFMEKIFISKTKETCEVALSVKESPMYVYLTGISVEEGEKALIVMVDNTERKLAEDAFKRKSEEMALLHSFFVGRELKMIELKKEINELLKESGREPKYEIAGNLLPG